MSAAHDRKFFDTFMLVLGILAAITIGLIVAAGIISSKTAVKFGEEDPLRQKETLQRIEPVARVAVAGQDNTRIEPARRGPGGCSGGYAGRPGLRAGVRGLSWHRHHRSTEARRQGGVGDHGSHKVLRRWTSTRSKASRARPATCHRRAAAPT